MTGLLAEVSAKSEELNVILLIGIAVFGGTVGAKIIQRLRIPQVVGYVTIGLILGLDGIRNTFATQELNDWLVAIDIAGPIIAQVTPETSLSDALDKTKKLDAEFLPVVASGNSNRYVGILDVRSVHRRLTAEVLAKQKEADGMYALARS